MGRSCPNAESPKGEKEGGGEADFATSSLQLHTSQVREGDCRHSLLLYFCGGGGEEGKRGVEGEFLLYTGLKQGKAVLKTILP